MSKKSFDHIRFQVIRADRLEDLHRLLRNEPRPYELVVHPSIAGARPVTIKATRVKDAQYFGKLLRRLAHGTDKIKQ